MLFITANSNLCVLVNAAAVATDEVYFATENGQILDVNFRHMNLFRNSTLYSLLGEVTSTIGRMGRPNNAVEFVKAMRKGADQSRNYTVADGASARAGSVAEGS